MVLGYHEVEDGSLVGVSETKVIVSPYDSSVAGG
jgi:hypothetical protein